MNYLAHLFLAQPTPDAMIGNLLGDFRTGIPLESYSPSIRQGIENHLRIDAFTDRHPIVRTEKQRFSQPLRRFAGIILDVLYDHYLAKNWTDYADIPLTDFSQQVYQILQQHEASLPAKLQRALPNMIQHNWLCSYRDLDTIANALERIGQRFKRPTPIAQSYDEIITHYQEFEIGFQTFFPALIDYAKTLP